jgi:hypothetical protein
MSGFRLPSPPVTPIGGQPISIAEYQNTRASLERIEQAFAEYGALTGIDGAGNYTIDELDDEEISFRWHETWSYGGSERHYATMPTAFLFDRENWQAEHERKQAEVAAAAAEQATKVRQGREKKDRAKLAKLLERYPDAGAREGAVS